MSADDAIAWQIAHPCPGCGTRYGLKAGLYVTRDVLRESSHRELRRGALRLAGLAAGGEVEWPWAERVVVDLGDCIGRDASETRRLWSWAQHKGEAKPCRAPTGGRMAMSGDIVDRVLDLQRRVYNDARLHAHPCAGSAFKVLDAFILMAIRCNRLEFDWSLRQIAEDAGVAADTVWRSRSAWGRYVNRLRSGSAHTGKPSRWRLVTRNPGALQVDRPEAIGDGYSGLSTSCASPGVHRNHLSDPRANYWVRDGVKRVVWLALDDREPMTAVEVHAAIHGMCHVGSVRRLLARMLADGVVERIDDGWLRKLDATEPPGVDYATARRERHEVQRMTWRTWRANDTRRSS
jgi:hypothetical protein